MLKKYRLLSKADAVRAIHCPATEEEAFESRRYFFSISEGSGSGRSSAWGRSWRTHLAMALLVSPSVWG